MANVAVTCSRHLDLVQMAQRRIHGGEVLLHHRFAALAVGLLDGVLDGGDRFLARQHAADGEEAGLHDGVDAPAHAGLARHRVAIDHVEPQLLVDDLLLHLRAAVASQTSSGPKGLFSRNVAPGSAHFSTSMPLQERELVAGHEIGRRNQVARMDRLRPEAQVRSGHRAGLLRVVDEVALRVIVGLLADDLDRVLVGAHRAVGAQAVEQRAHRARLFGRKARIVGQAGVRHVVVDADGEVILRRRLRSSSKTPLTIAGVNSLEERP